jgi:hypothetical protein
MREGLTIQRGICWGCLCNEYRACTDPGTGEACSWANAEETFCSVCALMYGEAVQEEAARQLQLGVQPATAADLDRILTV